MKKSQVLKNRAKKDVDIISDNVIYLEPMKRNAHPKGDHKITFIASPDEQKIIQAGLNKHGLRKVSDVLRMALRRFAEAEGLELKAS